jgi:Zn-dependent protease with chaperone function
VLDPTWQSPYAPTGAEKHDNQRAVRSFALRRKFVQTIIVSVVAMALIVGVAVAWWLPVAGVAVAALYAWDLRRSLERYDRRATLLGNLMLEQFKAGGSSSDRLRLTTVLDRLGATFGVDNVATFIVDDPGYNAALVPNGAGFSLFVTSALMRDFELIELEGVVAHCLARQRLGLLTRESVSAVSNLSDDARRALAGDGMAYRADEVAAAAIRYPLGLAGALRKCERHVTPASSFFVTPTYGQWRWIWFNIWSDRRDADLSDLDDVELRARALEEW